jgi:Ankyrin repeats (3 copies)
MSWKWLDRLRGGNSRKAGDTNGTAPQSGEMAINRDKERWGEVPAIPWIDAADNPWKVPVLDLRPYTLEMIMVTTEEQTARDAMALWGSDGSQYIGAEPTLSRSTPTSLRYRIDRVLAEGVLFVPRTMEHRWAIYYYGGKIICVSSWYHDVRLVANVRIRDGYAEITSIGGWVADEAEEPELTVRAFDFLIRSHAMSMIYPAPVPPSLSHKPLDAAKWCFGLYGDRVQFATVQHLPQTPPEEPLRSESRLHIAIVHGDAAAVRSHIDAGLPADLIATDGLTTLHWALVREGTDMLELLLERGVAVDVRSADGATALMNAMQSDKLGLVRFLLDRGADPNAADNRGFTALHRAAELGRLEGAKILLEHGARATPEAEGHTPRSLATLRGNGEIAAILEEWEKR